MMNNILLNAEKVFFNFNKREIEKDLLCAIILILSGIMLYVFCVIKYRRKSFSIILIIFLLVSIRNRFSSIPI